LRAEEIDDASVITRDVAVGLAEIEGERHELGAGRQLDAPDRAAQLLRHRSGRRERFLLQRREVETRMRAAGFQFLVRAGKSLRRPTALKQLAWRSP